MVADDSLTRSPGESGSDVRPITDKQAAESGLDPQSVLVDGFSFKSGASTYAVTSGGDGTLIGTRDGQAWKTWPITPARSDAGAAAALSTLQTLLFGPKPGAASNPGNGINRVA